MIAASGAAASDDIKIAQVAPFSGVQAPTGNAVGMGAKLYFDYINSTGGINGRKITLIQRDDEYKPERTVEMAQKLLDTEKPVLFINTIGTAPVEALIKSKVLLNNNIGLLGPATGAKSAFDAENVFPIRISYDEESARILRHLSMASPKRLAVLYQNDGYGKDVLASIQNHVKSYPTMSLVAAEPYEWKGAELSEDAANIAKLQPDAVILVAVTKPAISFIRNFRKLMPNVQLAAMSPVDPDILKQELSPNEYIGVLIGAAYPHPQNGREAIVAEMHKVQKLMNRTETATPRYMEGFMTAKTAVMALRRAGGTITSDSVKKGLLSLNYQSLGGSIMVNYADGKKGANYIDVGLIGKSQFIQ